MSKPIQTVEELDAVLHWRGKHAQAIRERDALQQLLNQRDEQIETMNQQHQGEAVAWRYREGEGAQWRLTDMPPSTWYFDPRQYEVRKLYEKPAPVAGPLDYGSLDAVQRLAVCRREAAASVAVVPDGYCIMPRQLTAENGAKALLLGEFNLQVTMECPECCDLEEPAEGCSICDGEGEYGQKHTIPWDQIKYIYSKAVSGLAVKTESVKSR